MITTSNGRWSYCQTQVCEEFRRRGGEYLEIVVSNSIKTEDSAVGFYALNSGSVVRWTENKEKEHICAVLETVRKQNPGQRILLVLDKHGSHTCEYSRNRAHQLGIHLIFLPSGSPHLNPIERSGNS